MEVTDKMIEAALEKRRELDKWVDDPWWMDDWLTKRLPDLFKAMLEAAK